MNTMTRSALPIRAAAVAVFMLVALAGGPQSSAVERGSFAMEILVDGRPLTEYAARGATYVQALNGREYSIRLRNETGGRIAVALSVDGLNTIDARKTPARDARKWILGPYESIVLDGWQTSTDTARRFYFTDEARSYGAWLGATDDLGIVAAAFFRERCPEPAAIEKDTRRSAPAAPRMKAAAESQGAAADDYAATGIGREREHRVRTVEFDAEPQPAATLAIRYEYRDALVRLGVVPDREAGRDPLARRERARGFEDDGFAPDPFRKGR